MYDVSLTGTIVAVSTPPGPGGIGIVRLSGPEALKIARSLFQPKAKTRRIEAGRVVLGSIADPDDGRPFDEGFLLYFKAPHSYTGEDVVEFDLHGSPVILEEIVRLAVRQGARPALPGEFTLRAFLSGRIDFLQAEAVDDLIRSSSLAQAKSAYRGVEGALTKKIAGLRDGIITLIARIEADIEFAEEKGPRPLKYYIDKIDRIRSDIETLVRSYEKGRALSRGVTIALVGRANSGKSTLFNDLLEEPRAIVTPFPGTTRDYIREKIRIKDALFVFVDMAGLGRPGSPIEREGIRRGKKIAAEADGILLLLEGSRRFCAADKALIESYRNRKIILVLNKIDLPQKAEVSDLQSRYADIPMVGISALKGTGVAELKESIYRIFYPLIPAEETIVFRKRDKLLLEEVSQRLLQTREMVIKGRPIEMIAEETREVVSVIGRITGEIRADDILNDIFSHFCIGK